MNKRRVEDLSDDDHRTAKMLTGAAHGRSTRERYADRDILPPRNCPPWMKKDPEMTRRFAGACKTHEASAARAEREMKSIQQEVDELIEKGKVKSFADIPEHLLVRVCMTQMADGRRPSAINKAVETAARIKGLLGDRQLGSADEALDVLLEKLELRRNSQATGPRSLEGDGASETG